MRYYVYEVSLDKNIYTELKDSIYYVGKHQTECKDLINDGYYGVGNFLNKLYSLYGYSGVTKTILKECKTEYEVRIFEKYYIQKCKESHGENCINNQISKKSIIISYDSEGMPFITYEKQPSKENQSFIWYTNGIKNIKIFNDEIPNGFYAGFNFKDSTLKRKAREKRNKELNKANLKFVPLKNRKLAYKQIKYEKIINKEKKQFLNNVHIPLIDMRIKEYLKRGLSNNEVFDKLKLCDVEYATKFNSLLEDYILEQALIYQLSTMPIYITTIVDSLKELYEKNRSLQYRKDLVSYFTSIFD